MNQNNRKILFIGTCAIIAVLVFVFIAVISMQKSNLSNSFFVSDDTKYVIPVESDEISIDEGSIRPVQKYLVYYYQGDAITGLKEYYLYNQESDAKAMYDYFKDTRSASYQAITTDGKYLILTANDSAYKNKTATEVKQYIEFLNSMRSSDNYSSNDYEEFDEDGNAIESDDDSDELD